MRRSLFSALLVLTVVAVPSTAGALSPWSNGGGGPMRTSYKVDAYIDPGTVDAMKRGWVYRTDVGSFQGQAITPAPTVGTGPNSVFFQAKGCADAGCTALDVSPILVINYKNGQMRTDRILELPHPFDAFSNIALAGSLPVVNDGNGGIVAGYGGTFGDAGVAWTLPPSDCLHDIIGQPITYSGNGQICYGGVAGQLGAPVPFDGVTETAPPALGKNITVVGSPQGYAAAFGDASWKIALATDEYPVIAGRNVVFTGASDLSARNLSTGAFRFRVVPTNPKDVMLIPAHANGTLYTETSSGVVRAVDSLTGEVRWTTDLPGRVVILDHGKHGPVTTGDVVFVATDTPTPKVTALDASTGEVVRRIGVGGDWISSMMLQQGTLFIVGRDRIVAWAAPGSPAFPGA